MALSDNNAERRNLMMMSMSIIAFYIGGGEISGDDGLKLPLISLKFDDYHNLAYLAWIMLIWFAFRYYLAAKGRVEIDIYGELNKERFGLFLFERWIRQLFLIDGKQGIKNVIYFYRLNDSSNTFGTNILVIKSVPVIVTLSGDQAFDNLPSSESPEFQVSYCRETKIIYFVSRLILFFRKPSQSIYYVPLILFYVAIGLGLYNELPTPIAMLRSFF